jgi:hypothetical protein
LYNIHNMSETINKSYAVSAQPAWPDPSQPLLNTYDTQLIRAGGGQSLFTGIRLVSNPTNPIPNVSDGKILDRFGNEIIGGTGGIDANAFHRDATDAFGASARIGNAQGQLFVGRTDQSTEVNGTDLLVSTASGPIDFESATAFNVKCGATAYPLQINPTEMTIDTQQLTLLSIGTATQGNVLFHDPNTGLVTTDVAPTPVTNAILDGGNPSTQEITIGTIDHSDDTNQEFMFVKCGVRPKALTYMYGSFGGSDALDATYRHIFVKVPPEMNGYFVTSDDNATKDGCLIQFSAGYATDPTKNGGYVRFASGANPNKILGSGDIYFDCGNGGYPNGGRRIALLGQRNGVMSVTENGTMGLYEASCTQPQDIPNNAYITANFAPLSGGNYAQLGGNSPASLMTIGTNNTENFALEQNNSQKILFDNNGQTTLTLGLPVFRNDSNMLFQNLSGSNTVMTINPALNSMQLAASAISLPNIPQATTTHQLYWNTLTGVITQDVVPTQLGKSYHTSAMRGNATVTSILNDIAFVNGSFGDILTSSAGGLISFNGTTNKYTWSGLTTERFKVDYTATMNTTALDIKSQFVWYIDDTADVNPNIAGRLAKSTIKYEQESVVNWSHSVSQSFVVELLPTQTLRLFYDATLAGGYPQIVEELNVNIVQL